MIKGNWGEALETIQAAMISGELDLEFVMNCVAYATEVKVKRRLEQHGWTDVKFDPFYLQHHFEVWCYHSNGQMCSIDEIENCQTTGDVVESLISPSESEMA